VHRETSGRRIPGVGLWIWLIGILFFQSLYPQPASLEPVFKWQIGEDLTYRVNWSFFRLGTLRIQVLEKRLHRGEPVYRCRLFIDSNPALPFVNIHDIYESFIGEDMFSRAFYAWEKKSGYVIYTEYQMDYQNNLLHIIIEKHTPQDTTRLLDSLATLDRKILDGLSILFYARAMAKHKAEIYVPVIAYNKISDAYLNIRGEKRRVKTRGEKVEGYYLDGRLKFVGIAGIKEGFRGWFSPDEQSVPIKAYMKAFIGSVRIELEEWDQWNARLVFKNPENWGKPLPAVQQELD